ncbi:tetratricopeptide repeat protein [Weissella ceti]|uniref:Tetratricopeptide repeat protein n=1 Tax=Weissella ceti TaxID=759620 RepID=A0ABT3E3E9_9LACO|nr:tetratricopeptide repeat protein [Weissella ceti]MCW0952928.1 tetratricopeptide repeat protein [Weissella ceti]
MASFGERMLNELALGQVDEAKKSFASSLRHDDDDTIYSLAEELYALGMSNQAKRAYEKLLERYPDEDQLRTALADIAIDEDDTDAAMTYLADIKPTSNAYLESLMVLADLYQSEGLYEPAESKLKEAYSLAPEEPVIGFALAEYYFASAKYQEAIAYYRELLKNGDRYFSGTDIASRIGVAYALVGDVTHALAYLEQIKPTELTPDVRFQLGMLYAADEETHQKAIDTFEELMDIDASYATLYEPLGNLYEHAQQDEDALRTYQAGLAVDQFNTKLVERAAILSERLGSSEQAETLYQEGLRPGDTTLLDYSDWLVLQRKHTENISLLNDYLADDEADIDPIIYRNLAQSYTALEDYEMATQYWQAAVPLFIDDANFLREAFFYFRENGNHELALETLTRYVELVPTDLEMSETLAGMADSEF